MKEKYINDRRPSVAIIDIDKKLVESLAEEFMVSDLEVSYKSDTVEPETLLGIMPDMIILGSRLSEGDGIKLLKKIKRHPALKFIPVIVLTPPNRPGEMELALRSGALDVLAKPIHGSLLKMKILRFFEDVVPLSRTKTEFIKYMQQTIDRHIRRGHDIYTRHFRDFSSAPSDWEIPIPDLVVGKGNSFFVYEFVTLNDLLEPGIIEKWKTFNQFKDISLRICVKDKEDEEYVRKLVKTKGIRARIILLGIHKERKVYRKRLQTRTIVIVVIVSIALGVLLSLPMKNIYELSRKWVDGVIEQYNKYEPKDLQRGDKFDEEIKQLKETKKKLKPPPK